jgi:hypothetical protein
MRPPDETSLPSPLQCTGPAIGWVNTTCFACVRRSITHRLSPRMTATRSAPPFAASAGKPIAMTAATAAAATQPSRVLVGRFMTFRNASIPDERLPTQLP